MTKTGRYLAQLVLDRVEQDGAYANLALREVLNENAESDQREKAFCTELVYGTLRHLLTIDFILGRLLSRPLASLKIPLKNTLRLAIYQLLYLTEIPERAVCHAAVEQVKHSRFAGLSGLANGIVRNFLRNRNSIVFPDRTTQPVEYLTTYYSHPQWLAQRWLDRYGLERTERLMTINNDKPPLTVRINQTRTTVAELHEELALNHVAYQPGLFLQEAINILTLPGTIDDLPSFRAGKLFVQDESSMMVAHILEPKPDEIIVDLCAAPGGKSTHLAELMQNKGQIYSIDDHPHKINLIAANCERLGLTNITPRCADARNFQLPEGGQADAVLVDAPCSGTGVLRRRVDLRYRHEATATVKLVKVQREILIQAAKLIKPGGRLVYSTCTLEPEENQAQVEWFCQNHPEYKISDWRGYLPTAITDYLEDSLSPWATFLPISGGGDGFFICRLDKCK